MGNNVTNLQEMISNRDGRVANLQEEAPRRKISPLVESIRTKIDALYIHYVGPIGSSICKEYYIDWMARGSNGPGDLVSYIRELGEDIPRATKRDEFERAAIKLIRLVK